MPTTAKAQLASLKLGVPVAEFIADRRAASKPKSFRAIAQELRDLTHGEVDVTDVTVRAWLTQAEIDAAQAAAS